jgi:TonB-linked SusC/RagA family outer membrane protein
MTEASAVLSDVVVVGYGTQKKVNLTGSVASVSGERLESRPITNLGSGLQGLIPNLNINRGNGVPGAGASFNIRGGQSNLTNTDPLILVDGVQMDANLVNPDDVESVTVLKDASSAAIYGVRGANGVILITTKTPKNTPVRINYTGSYATTRPTRMPEFMNSIDYIRLHREADRTGALSGGDQASEKYSVQDSIMAEAHFRDPANNPSVYALPNNSKYRYVGNTDWIDVLYPGWAPMTQHSLSLSGGQGKTSFSASMGYFEQTGLLEVANDKYRRFNPTIKINTAATPWLDFNFKATLNYSNQDRPTPASHGGMSSGWIATDLRPTMPVYHPDGNYSGQGNFTNMVALAKLNGRMINRINDLFLTGGAVLKPVKNVRVVTDYTWNSKSIFMQRHAKEYNEYGVDGALLGTFPWSRPSRLTEEATDQNYQVFNIYADYENTFADRHYFKLMVGYNQEYLHNRLTSTSVKNLIDQEKPAINQHSDPAPIVGGRIYDWAISGSFFRLNYIFDDRYLLEVNGRYDGTSRFPRGNRYTFLPSISAGWRVSEENFFEPLKDVVSELKIRGSYGTLGNQIRNDVYYGYLATLPLYTANTGLVPYVFNGIQPVGVNPPGLVSQNYSWEKITTANFGIDIGLLKNKLTASIDAYIRETKDILAPGTPVPALLGASVPTVNSADMRTKGWELSLNWKDRLNKDLSYDITLALSDNRSKITRYNNPNKTLNTFYEGMEVGEIWGFETVGFFESDAVAAATNQNAIWGGTWLAGDIRFADLNKDGKIDFGASTVENPGDRKVIGNSTPRYQYGVSLGVNYKGFDFTAFIQGTGKRDFMLGGTYFWPFAGGEWDVPQDYQLDHWTPQNPDAYYPRIRFAGGNNQTQTKYLQKASYMRMKNLSLGYSLPGSIISRAKLLRARIYISGENLFESTKLHEAFDPELLGATEYPLNRAVSVGIQLGL